MKFVLQFSNPDYFVGHDETGYFKTDNPELVKTWDSYNAASESEARKAFPHDQLTVMPAEGEGFSACLGEDEGSCVLDCGCVLYRSASHTDLEVSITFCPMHDAAEKTRDVLGRLHDLVSDLIEETDHLDGMRESDPAAYRALVDLLLNESMPLFAEGERGKAPAAPVVPVAPPADLLKMWAEAPMHCEENDDRYAPAFGCECTPCRLMRETGKAIAARSAAPVKGEPVAYKVWVCVEPVDAEGENAGEDLDLPFASVAEFRDPTAAIELATDMHDQFSA